MIRRRWLPLPAAIGLVLLMTTPVFAYVTQVPTLVTVSPSSETMRCGHPYLVDATVLDQNGQPIKQLAVTWAFTSTPSASDSIRTVLPATNGHGVARSQVRLTCVPGDRIITATAGGVSGSAVVHVALGHPHAAAGSHAATTNTAAVPGKAARIQTTTANGVTADLALSGETTPADPAPAPLLPWAFVLLATIAIAVRRITIRRR